MIKKSWQACVAARLTLLTVSCCCAVLLPVCGPLPNSVDNGNYSIQLRLEDGTKTTATFSGQPIIASILLPDSCSYDSIAWHTGKGQVRHTGIAPDARVKKVDVELFWLAIPLCKDTATKQLYDTVYVSTHGETERSNKVTVYVTNVPPMIDSVRIGSAAARNDDTIRFSISTADTNTILTIRVGAHDLNGDALNYDWYSSRGEQLAPTTTVQYIVPGNQFIDTIFVTVYDGKGGSAHKTVILSKMPPDNPPVIDSVRVGAVVFNHDTTFHIYASRSIDTLRFRVYAHDPDAGDSLTVTWTKKNIKDSLARGSGGQTLATLICDTIYRKPGGGVKTVDTITILVKDSRGDSAKTTVRILQGYVNTPPKLDSISVNGVIQCKGATVLSRDTATASMRDTFMLRIFASDADSGDSAHLTAVSKIASQLTKLSDTAARYICKDSVYTDTVFFTVKDLAGDSAKKSILIAVVNRPPTIDSIRVNKAIQCKGTTTLVIDSASGADTLVLRGFATDSDTGDSVKLTVSARKSSCFTKVSDSIAQYVCKDSLYLDTIVFVAKDLELDSVKKSVVVAVINRLPRIDSLMVTDTLGHRTATYKTGDSLVTARVTIAIKDSAKVRLFAHDPDPSPKDSIAQIQWTLSSGKTMRVLDTKGLIVQYPGQDTATVDTIRVNVADTRRKSSSTMMIFETK